MDGKPKTLLDAVTEYANPDNALDEVVDSRWQDGPVCPHCGAVKPMFLKTRRIWKCTKCRKQFSIKVGTLLEESPIGLDKWLPAVWMIANSRNGVSSWELSCSLGVTQKTAWFMLHRIRLAMQDDLSGGSLCGEVEIDETFIGGKARNMHKDRKKRTGISKSGARNAGKTVVLGMLERKGKVRATVVPDRSKVIVKPLIMGNVEKGSEIISDEWGAVYHLDSEYVHSIVNHAECYVKGNVHTNTLEISGHC